MASRARHTTKWRQLPLTRVCERRRGRVSVRVATIREHVFKIPHRSFIRYSQRKSTAGQNAIHNNYMGRGVIFKKQLN